MISYILESSICLACFYTFYWLFLRREKLLSINRFYLLITAAFSMVIPLLDIGIPSPFANGLDNLSTSIPARVGVNTEQTAGTTTVFSFKLIYVIGLVASIGLLIVKLLMVRNRVTQWLSLKRKRVEVIESDAPEAFSFLNTIFISRSLDEDQSLKEQVIAHEAAHINGRHSLDLMFFEVIKCVYWFNPFSYLYTRSIKLQHEYIADQAALAYTDTRTYERSLLQLTLSKVNNGLVSSFNEHPIEKRLKMIQKLNSNIMNKLKLLFALPVFAMLLIAFSCEEEALPETLVEEMEIPIDQSLNVYTEVLEEYSATMELLIDSLNHADRKKAIFKYRLHSAEEEEIPFGDAQDNRFVLKELIKHGENPEIQLELKDKSNNEFIELPIKKH